MAVVVGLAMLWRLVLHARGPWTWRSLVGPVLAGWGAFNLVEGIVNHQILQIHHVRMESDVDHVWAWDLGFLVLGGLLVSVGSWIHRRDARL